jgi:(heptosyl)LPS beta-1,4-glucosyltransferase
MSENKLSVVIIAKNEEKIIANCLNSIKDLADEIIVIDDCSTDETPQICKEYGAKVIVNDSKGLIERQKILGINEASNDWILLLEADMVIPDKTKEKIKEFIKEPKDYVGFRFKRVNFLFNKPILHCGACNYDLRLFKKGFAFYEEKIHFPLYIIGKTKNVDSEIYHFTYDSISEAINIINKYTEEEAKDFISKVDFISKKEIKYRLTWKALKLFWKLYIKKKGYKDGMYGLIWAIINVIGPEIRWLKIWEKALKEGKLQP